MLNNLSSRFVSALAFFSIANLIGAQEHEHREHVAHEHGSAQLTIAMEGGVLEMIFSSPAINIVGFEHTPKNEDQHGAVSLAVERLKQWRQLFELPAEAGCRLEAVSVDSELLEQQGHEHGDHDEYSHADFKASYRFRCQSLAALDSIRVTLFEQFPGNEHIEVQYISPAGQGMQELDAGHNRVEFTGAH